ncbi:RBR-type E3 ubiquitin transferase [Mycena chlorophos]|uniref:RBR-type E3 ubiquitin transferase n=1 Tax=Mycena chlorophos TaxID=658473 RepID=A0A8H6TM51_MYCCL|nr:RBR-type E3 ubiquitin transferase [Mycena chlorophos]
MFKKYKAFLNNQGQFEQPGARALRDFVDLYDHQREQQKERERVDHALQNAEERLKSAEAKERAKVVDVQHTERANVEYALKDAEDRLKLAEAKERLKVAEAKARIVEERVHRLSIETATSTVSYVSSRLSDDSITRERLFRQAITPPPDTPVPERPRLSDPQCAVCGDQCYVCPDPWQRTHDELLSSRNHEFRRTIYGLVLSPCGHVFCGTCLAQFIYHSLNMAFDPRSYGRELPSYPPDSPSSDLPEFPISCPRCQLTAQPSDKRLPEISDAIACCVLGDMNMLEWNQARYMASLQLMWCPYRDCNRSFDVNDAHSLGSAYLAAGNCIRCPHCNGFVCKSCKSAWHENLSCLVYQATTSGHPPRVMMPSERKERPATSNGTRRENLDAHVKQLIRERRRGIYQETKSRQSL